MAEEYDPYPIICECCPAEFDENEDSAKAAGWRLGWDGWICKECGRPQATDEMIDAACAAVPDMFRVDAARAIEAALAVMPSDEVPDCDVSGACKGKNCGCTDGVSHSPECYAEHDASIGITPTNTEGARGNE